MAFLPAVVAIEDSAGDRIDEPRDDGTQAPIVLVLDDTLTGSSTASGGLTKVTIGSNPTGTPQFATVKVGTGTFSKLPDLPVQVTFQLPDDADTFSIVQSVGGSFMSLISTGVSGGLVSLTLGSIEPPFGSLSFRASNTGEIEIAIGDGPGTGLEMSLVMTEADLTISRSGQKLKIDANGIIFGPGSPVAGPTFTQTYATTATTFPAYTPDDESVAYTGAADGEAKLTDLNALRVAYENLRAHCEAQGKILNTVLDRLQSLMLAG
jgi:hypothetical protein